MPMRRQRFRRFVRDALAVEWSLICSLAETMRRLFTDGLVPNVHSLAC